MATINVWAHKDTGFRKDHGLGKNKYFMKVREKSSLGYNDHFVKGYQTFVVTVVPIPVTFMEVMERSGLTHPSTLASSEHLSL